MKPIWHFFVTGSNRGDMGIAKSIQDAIRERVDIPIASFSVRHDELDERRIEQLNDEASMLLIGGSGLYTNYKLSSGWYFSCDSNLFDKIKVPIVLMGIGSNNNFIMDLYGELHESTKESIRKINDLAALSSVRDLRTFNMLRNFGVDKPELIADPACFLRCESQVRENLVGINIAQHIPMLGRFNVDGNYRSSNIYNYKKICEHLYNIGFRVVFITHDCLEHNLVEEFVSCFPNMEYINSDDINEMLRVYSRCKLTVGVRTHSNIFSFASGTPFISTYYDAKGIEFLKMVNSDFGVSVTEKDFYRDVNSFIDELLGNYGVVKANLVNRRDTLRIDYDRFADAVCELVCSTTKT